MERLAVIRFSGENGEHVADAVQDQLARQPGYTLVSESELHTQHAACALGPSAESLLEQARERGVDGLVTGEVLAFRCEDDLRDSLVSESDRDQGRIPSVDELFNPERGELHRHAEIEVALRLLDTRTGEVRAELTARHEFDGSSAPGQPPLPSRPDVLNELTAQCVDDFLKTLAPHQQDFQMELARGGWMGRSAADVRAGNRFASEGDWDAARDAWQRALDRDSECDAALYNLALDAAHRQRYADAENLAMQAIRLRHTDDYAAGLERIRLYRSGYDAAQEQRDRDVLQASASFR
jgi:tetratricopeptide (TPR) repeat protein